MGNRQSSENLSVSTATSLTAETPDSLQAETPDSFSPTTRLSNLEVEEFDLFHPCLPASRSNEKGVVAVNGRAKRQIPSVQRKQTRSRKEDHRPSVSQRRPRRSKRLANDAPESKGASRSTKIQKAEDNHNRSINEVVSESDCATILQNLDEDQTNLISALDWILLDQDVKGRRRSPRIKKRSLVSSKFKYRKHFGSGGETFSSHNGLL